MDRRRTDAPDVRNATRFHKTTLRHGPHDRLRALHIEVFLEENISGDIGAFADFGILFLVSVFRIAAE